MHLLFSAMARENINTTALILLGNSLWILAIVKSTIMIFNFVVNLEGG